MPILTGTDAGGAQIMAIIPASSGYRAVATAPAGTTGVPTPGDVVAWAQVADPAQAGGARVDPVFLAAGRTWTPDQFRDQFGAALNVTVERRP